jgi:hypothetical protein
MLSLWSEVFLLAQRSISPLLSTKDVVPDPVGMEQQVSLVRDWLRLATDKHAKCRRYLREMLAVLRSYDELLLAFNPQASPS